MKLTWEDFAATPVIGIIDPDEIEMGRVYRVRNTGYRIFIAVDVEIEKDEEKR